jgi:hypothetical protein
MTRMLRGVAVITLATAISASCSNSTPSAAAKLSPEHAQTPGIVYDLREKCGRDARDWFQHFHGADINSDVPSAFITTQDEYSNHYNETLNRCYALVLISKMITSEKGVRTQEMDLVEVNENRQLGRFFINSTLDKPMYCNVEDQKCNSQAEWANLTAPYMSQ